MMETLGFVLLVAPVVALFVWLRRRDQAQARRDPPADGPAAD